MFCKGVTNRNTWTVTSISDELRDIDFHVREKAAALYKRSGKDCNEGCLKRCHQDAVRCEMADITHIKKRLVASPTSHSVISICFLPSLSIKFPYKLLGVSSYRLDILNTEWISTAVKRKDNILITSPLITSHEMDNLRFNQDCSISLM
jgi:hypothetical protein